MANVQTNTQWALTPQAYCREIASFLKTNPGAWCQGSGARTGDGTPVHPMNPHARMFCMLGLLERFVGDVLVRERAQNLLRCAIAPHVGSMSPHTYNDIAAADVQDIIQRFEEASRITDAEAIHAPTASPFYTGIPEWKKALYGDALDPSESMLKDLVPWSSIMVKMGREAAA